MQILSAGTRGIQGEFVDEKRIGFAQLHVALVWGLGKSSRSENTCWKAVF